MLIPYYTTIQDTRVRSINLILWSIFQAIFLLILYSQWLFQKALDLDLIHYTEVSSNQSMTSYINSRKVGSGCEQAKVAVCRYLSTI